MSSSGNLRLINISWVPLEEQLWNGVPYIYIVYLTRPDETVVTHFVHFPHSNILISLQAGVYGVQVEAVNEVGLAGKTTDLVSLDLTASSGLSVADYPYFYIIIPGLVFLAVIIAIPIFIFRKIHENKMRSISYVRGQLWWCLVHSVGVVCVTPLHMYADICKCVWDTTCIGV